MTKKSNSPEPSCAPSTKKRNKKNPVNSSKPHYFGHRQRLRERFLTVGQEALSDYEVLELLLFRSIARSDTKEPAKALLKRFRSLAEVLGAPLTLLKEVKGIGEATACDLKIIACAAQRMAKSKIIKREILSSWETMLDYCRTTMAFEEKENVRIVFLDKKNGIIADEVQQKGTIDHTPIYPREIIKRTLELSASAIIIVHNHPSGDPTPSNTDVHMTRNIIDLAKPFSISVYDHIIVGKNDSISMRQIGLI